LPHWESRNSLWIEYALYGMTYLASSEDIDGVAWPTGELAEQDQRTHVFRGWYWQDSVDSSGKTWRARRPWNDGRLNSSAE
jgi:hypothetical protein